MWVTVKGMGAVSLKDTALLPRNACSCLLSCTSLRLLTGSLCLLTGGTEGSPKAARTSVPQRAG